MATTGRNAPCYCGSGRPYKDCCFLADVDASHVWVAENVFDDFGAPGEETGIFLPQADAEASLDRFGARGNSTPVYEFCGLTPDEMHRFLYSPFDSPDRVKFNVSLRRFPEAPFFRMLSFLLDGAAAHLRTTERGNLSRSFVREAARLYYGEPKSRSDPRPEEFQSELEFLPLHVVRLTAELSGMIRKEKGGIKATKKGGLVAKEGMTGQIFLDIFQAYVMKFNWAYSDRYPDIPVIQASFLFMLYALARYGERYRPAAFYEDLFLAAFPQAVRDVPGSVYETPEHAVKRCLSLRMLNRFALFFGFIELKERRPDRRGGLGELKKTNFLDDWIVFEEK